LLLFRRQESEQRTGGYYLSGRYGVKNERARRASSKLADADLNTSVAEAENLELELELF